MKQTIKFILNIICQILVLPCAILCWLERMFSRDAEILFSFWAHCVAILPGIPGVFLRRAFYCLTLNKCSPHCYIGYGSLFTHRRVVVEDHVSLGIYTIIGSAHLAKGCEIGSRVSIVSGKHLHSKDDTGQWTPFDSSRLVQVKIAPNVWIGEGAIILADVGEGSLVGAGAVVVSEVPARVIAAGNPARVIKHFTEADKKQNASSIPQ